MSDNPRGRPHKPATERADSQLQIRLPRERKAAYVKAAQRKGMKLSAWVVEALDREAG